MKKTILGLLVIVILSACHKVPSIDEPSSGNSYSSTSSGTDYAPENPAGLTFVGLCSWINFEFKSNNSATLHLAGGTTSAGTPYDYFENMQTTMTTSSSRATVKYTKLGKNRAQIDFSECWLMYIYNKYSYREIYDCVRGAATIVFTSSSGGTIESGWYTNGDKYTHDTKGYKFTIKR